MATIIFIPAPSASDPILSFNVIADWNMCIERAMPHISGLGTRKIMIHGNHPTSERIAGMTSIRCGIPIWTSRNLRDALRVDNALWGQQITQLKKVHDYEVIVVVMQMQHLRPLARHMRPGQNIEESYDHGATSIIVLEL